MDIKEIKMVAEKLQREQNGSTPSDRELLLYIMHKQDDLSTKLSTQATNCNTRFMTREEFKTILGIAMGVMGATWTAMLGIIAWIKSKFG